MPSNHHIDRMPSNKLHELKTWPPFYEAVVEGRKRFEIRRDDRGFRVNDCLWLCEWIPQTKAYTGRRFPVRVTYLTASFAPEGFVAMSVEPWTDLTAFGQWLDPPVPGEPRFEEPQT